MKIDLKVLFFGLITNVMVGSCTSQSEKSRQDDETMNQVISADSIWFNFLDRMKEKDIEFLVSNSLDTIQCADCNLTEDRKQEWYESGFVFNKHLDKLMHLKDLDRRGFTTFSDDKLIRVNYKIKAEGAREGGYNLIFFFVKTDKKILFRGMIVT